jgi:DNA replication and repair protein RecF
VEHSYRKALKKFKRTLKQRNSLLRCDRINIDLLNSWNTEFVSLAELIDKYRKIYLLGLVEKIKWVLSEITDLGNFEFKYYSGWDTDKKLSEILEKSQQRDINMRVTTHGPQRSDLRISVDAKPANEVLSRGQSKILVTAMQIAQGYLFYEKKAEKCLYLIDDLPSELDFSHRKKVGKLLWDLGAQTFITGVLKEDLLNSWPREDLNMKMFHVEHGKITQ